MTAPHECSGCNSAMSRDDRYVEAGCDAYCESCVCEMLSEALYDAWNADVLEPARWNVKPARPIEAMERAA